MATPTDSPSPMLDLQIFPVRPTIKIDQVSYELRTVNDFTLAEYTRWERELPLVGRLLYNADKGLNKAESADVSRRLDALCRLVLMAPEDIQRKIGDINRIFIIKAFFERLPPVLRTTAITGRNLETTTSPNPGRKASRGSKRSMGATR
jgi:hypothetical protein